MWRRQWQVGRQRKRTRSRSGSTRRARRTQSARAHPRARGRGGPHGHRRRRRAGPQHARPRGAPRRRSRCAVPPRPNKEQLYDLILDAVLAEVDSQVDPALPWTAQVAALAHRLRSVLEDRPGVAALLKIRDPLSPASLALAEAFLEPLLAAGLPGREAAAAFRLIYDYTLGFAVADPTSPAEQRLRDAATREQLQAFLRALPASRFPALAAYGIHAWSADRDQRFVSGLDIPVRGLEAVQRPDVSSIELFEKQHCARDYAHNTTPQSVRETVPLTCE